jgi:predicted transcriptional regulator
MDLRTIRVLKNVTQWDLQKAGGVAQPRIGKQEMGIPSLRQDEKEAKLRAMRFALRRHNVRFKNESCRTQRAYRRLMAKPEKEGGQ